MNKKIFLLIYLILLLVIISCNDNDSAPSIDTGSISNAVKESINHIEKYCSTDFIDLLIINECMTDEHVHINKAWDCMKKQTTCEIILECTQDNFICDSIECSGVEVDCKNSVYFDQITIVWDFRSAFGNCSSTVSSIMYNENGDFLNMTISACVEGKCLSDDEIIDRLCN